MTGLKLFIYLKSDIGYDQFKLNGRYVSKRPLPLWKRPAWDYFWQRNPYDLNGHENDDKPYAQYASLDFLLPYWMGRYYHLLSCPQ